MIYLKIVHAKLFLTPSFLFSLMPKKTTSDSDKNDSKLNYTIQLSIPGKNLSMLDAEEMIGKQLEQIREQLMSQALENHDAAFPRDVLAAAIDQEVSKLGPQLLMAMMEQSDNSPAKPSKKPVKKAAKQTSTSKDVASSSQIAGGSGLILRVTSDLAKRLKVTPRHVLSPPKDLLLDWSAFEFIWQRQRFLILANTASLYCTIAPMTGVDIKRWNDIVAKSIESVFVSASRGTVFTKRVLPSLTDIRYSKMLNRSVTSSLSQMAYESKIHLDLEVDPSELTARLNDVPRTAIAPPGDNYGYPNEVFRSL